MPSSRQPKQSEVKDFVQMPLDFVQENQYINEPYKGAGLMQAELFEKLEKKIEQLLDRHQLLTVENKRLTDENERLLQDKELLKGRVDNILSKLEGI
jgi:cell division protein ZapB